jgi:two-component system response regulator MprA
VIIVSVIPEAEDGLTLGAADYLVKPLDESRLLEAIDRLLAKPDDGSRPKILVVDDEIDIVGWLKHSLSHFGYDVDEAYDGIQCLEAVDHQIPDLIIMDMKMPRMDGRTAIRRLREREDSRDVPIIVLSAHLVSDEAERETLTDYGVKATLSKPVTIDHLVEEIQGHLA